MAAKMTAGSVVLVAWCAATGRLGAVTHLTGPQWRFVLLTGAILLVFTAATLVAIRHAQVTTVVAVGMAAPVVTLALQEVAGRAGRVASADVGGLALTVAAVLVVVAASARAETSMGPRRGLLPAT
jgi:hypothetical protein